MIEWLAIIGAGVVAFWTYAIVRSGDTTWRRP